MTTVIVHYQEITLKGRNRSWFINMLARNVRQALADLDVVEVRSTVGRLELTLASDDHWEEARIRLSRLPGIDHFARAVHVPADVDAMAAAVIAGLQGRTPLPFRIKVHRADKRFALTSPQLERLIGQKVVDAVGWPVDLSHPKFVVRIDVLMTEAYVFFDREPGTGGLTVGSGGKAVCLLSGGIDSPVAAWRLIRRGVRVPLVHFHSYPILNDTSQEKARELAATLTKYQLKTRLYLVPIGAFQQQVVVTVPPELRVIIYRRMMVRLAERIALRIKADALITGEVVGQVASQTLENIRAIDDAATLPILRPLIGTDKDVITQEAMRIGTYETSIIPDQDCCTLFTPRYPATRAAMDTVLRAEAALDVQALMDEALAGIIVEDRRFPGTVVEKVENDKMRRLLTQETHT
ncbi:MAG: tRNA 4-thiouridine(8) synthase ThiI [Acidobacteria bacterium]|nr:tRNA 4-thiouridine(8) synthase ThiI [Acidobacteriota bacterium]